jgi:hypothetical protein
MEPEAEVFEEEEEEEEENDIKGDKMIKAKAPKAKKK